MKSRMGSLNSLRRCSVNSHNVNTIRCHVSNHVRDFQWNVGRESLVHRVFARAVFLPSRFLVLELLLQENGVFQEFLNVFQWLFSSVDWLHRFHRILEVVANALQILLKHDKKRLVNISGFATSFVPLAFERRSFSQLSLGLLSWRSPEFGKTQAKVRSPQYEHFPKFFQSLQRIDYILISY